MTKVHEAAAVGFERAADAYERGRPEYSPEAVAFVQAELAKFQREFRGPSSGLNIADVAAGTGKFTRVLASFAKDLVGEITAVEPVAAMRAKCAQKLADDPRVTSVDGTAEKLPFENASLDVVTVAQAFHWFDGSLAVPEIHRVLKSGGMVLLIWNVRDESFPWIREMTELMLSYEGTAPRYRSMKWRETFDRETYFSPLKMTSMKHLTVGTIDVMLDRVASVSFVASLPESDRNELLAKTRELYLRELRATFGEEPNRDSVLAMPYEAQIFIARKR